MRRPSTSIAVGLVLFALLSSGPSHGEEIAPSRLLDLVGDEASAVGVYSDRTVVAGIELDRDGARLVGYTVKPRPFTRPVTPRAVVPYEDHHQLQVEIVLHGPGDRRYTQRVPAGMICLSHGAGAEPHVAGDTIRMHRDSFLVELPELPGFETIEIATHRVDRGSVRRTAHVVERMDPERFTPAGTSGRYETLAFARRDTLPGESAAPLASTVIWPEDVADPDIFLVYGDEAESDRRINIVIVPDGYTYAEKALMEQHANATVAHFRNKSPHREHDPFINYVLVYAYSLESGTDQCDCGIIVDTAMGTRFPEATPSCGNSNNRCLSYGGSCDTSGTSNIVAAELRAPAHDETLVMVNTTRYGGCGGSRATFSAGNSAARELAVHELGHSMGGLADEYFYNSECGGFAGGINTSTDAVAGTWPEWIGDLGPPKEGGQYYGTCIYRPENDCEMRTLNRPFCSVCKQHYSLLTYAHPRVAGTAPIGSVAPTGTSLPATAGVPVDFSVGTRLSASPATHEIEWTLDGPGTGGPQVVATAVDLHSQTFTQEGQYSLTVEVTADTNLVKPARYGSNRQAHTWVVDVVALPEEVSPPGSSIPLRFTDPQTLTWEDTAAGSMLRYNLYRGDLPPAPGAYGDCLQSGIGTPGATVSDVPGATSGWFYLVTGRNTAGEGSMGQSSTGVARTSATPCP